MSGKIFCIDTSVSVILEKRSDVDPPALSDCRRPLGLRKYGYRRASRPELMTENMSTRTSYSRSSLNRDNSHADSDAPRSGIFDERPQTVNNERIKAITRETFPYGFDSTRWNHGR